MTNERIDGWAELLLDTGKRNNLVNFRDTVSSTLEIVLPFPDRLFSLVCSNDPLEVYFPETLPMFVDEDDAETISKDNYIASCRGAIRHNQIVVYSKRGKHLNVLKSISKKAASAMEETGVNVAYIAMGFVHWTESKDSEIVMRAPVLLAPITIRNDSSIDPFYISVVDDIIVNPTFAYKLQNEYGIKLHAYDDTGVIGYLNYVADLLSQLKWDVSHESKIGLFSFLKINMYQDIKDNAALIAQNGNVKGMLGDEYQQESTSFEYEESTEQPIDIRNIHEVIDADSSQIEAISMARSGRSFVIQGPPGTGKSQTITNIIAECLSAGKKVLFVSEKLAALNVVYDKLKRVGLADFCLELHSHKANKKDVVKELIRTIKAPKTIVSPRAQTELDELYRTQKCLDDYTTELHTVRPVIETTLYQLFESAAACRSAQTLEYVIPNIQNKGKAYLKDVLELLSRYSVFASTIGEDYHKSPWYGFKVGSCTYEAKIQLRHTLEAVINRGIALSAIAESIQTRFHIAIISSNDIVQTKELLEIMAGSVWFYPLFIAPETRKRCRVALTKAKERRNNLNEIRGLVTRYFDEDILTIDAICYYDLLTNKYHSIIARLFSKEYKDICCLIENYSRGKKVSYRTATEILEKICAYRKSEAKYKAELETLAVYFGDVDDTIIDSYEDIITMLDRLSKLDTWTLDLAAFSAITNESYKTLMLDVKPYAEIIQQTLDSTEQEYNSLVNSFFSDEFDIAGSSFDRVQNKLAAMLKSYDLMEHWSDFSRLMNSAKDLGLQDFLDFTIDKGLHANDLCDAYKKVFIAQWIDNIMHSSPVLMSLTRIMHDNSISTFRQKDTLRFDINRAYIKSQLSAQRPDLDMVAGGSATSIILREGEKKRKLKSIRTLLLETGELIQTIKPCFLMSPLSVSTYLAPETKFDVVIFDEASQILPQDAVGAIYRGEQLIVVGDSKQMPPSNFFMTLTEDDDEDEDEGIADYESILDICSSFMPQLRLKWHYRSRFEELIAFSNKNFYENDLVTFPSALQDGDGVGINYYNANGTYDRKTKTNRAEAEAIVDMVFDHFEKFPNRSLGVVAFNINQQELIDRLISMRRQKDVSKESFFNTERPEPFFVKNLETVQGDERDTIIFSIAYAPDAQGRFILNFGPLNRDGGERRLNVAVTRAKYNVKVVSSIHAFNIDLSRTSSNGTRLLREYLDYAENGTVALERSIQVNAFEQYDSDFELEVGDYLRDNGYAIDTQVGCSSFRIDIAIKEPNTSHYLLAVECDGASYHSSRSARDRDRLRQEILERMGWKFYRIWSTDWFRNKAIEQQKLLDAASSALKATCFTEVPVDTKQDTPSFEVTNDDIGFDFPIYRSYSIWELEYSYSNPFALIRSIVEKESPVSEEWLLKRIVPIFGREKVTSVVRDEYERLMWGCESKGIAIKDGFLYRIGAPIPMLRIPGKNEFSPREIKYIALEELANGLEEIVRQNVTVNKNNLFQFIVQKLGFSRTGDAIYGRLDAALKLCKNVLETNGVLSYIKTNQ